MSQRISTLGQLLTSTRKLQAVVLAAWLVPAAASGAEFAAERLYEGAAPGSESWSEPEVARATPNGGAIYQNVRDPTLQTFPPEKVVNVGTAVVLLPGGGLQALGVDTEVREIVRRLNDRGVTVFLLKYRIAQISAREREQQARTPQKLPHLTIRNANANPAPDDARLSEVFRLAVSDTQTAMRRVRERSRALGIDPARVGLLGISAGGGVSIGTYLADDEASRPSFIATLFGPSLVDVAVKSDAPPLFIATETDHGPVTDGLVALFELWRAAQRPVEMHVFDVPNFQMRTTLWMDRFINWLEAKQLLAPRQTQSH